jgi:hypothetical protein
MVHNAAFEHLLASLKCHSAWQIFLNVIFDVHQIKSCFRQNFYTEITILCYIHFLDLLNIFEKIAIGLWSYLWIPRVSVIWFQFLVCSESAHYQFKLYQGPQLHWWLCWEVA